MQRVTEILILVDEQNRKARAKRISDPGVLFDHAIGEKRHVIEINQALSSQFALIGFDERRKLRMPASPLRPAAIDVTASLLRGKAPPTMRIVDATDRNRICRLDRGARFRPCRDPEIGG